MEFPTMVDFKYHQFLNRILTWDSKKVGVALFGAGVAGMIHLGNLMQNLRVDLLYVVEQDEDRSRNVQSAMGLKDIAFVNCSKIDQVLDDPRVQAVMITTPTRTHEDLVIQALNKGKAVFCEKPLAKELEGIRKCYKLAKEKGLPLFCAFQRRFDPSYLHVHQRVRNNNELGKLHMVKSCSRDSPCPSLDYLRTSSGIFHDSAVHDIDMVCWMLGEFPIKVYASATAHMTQIAGIDDHDTVAVNMTFPSGALGMIDLSRFACYGYDQRLEVFGPGGMLKCGNQKTLGVESFKAGSVVEPSIWFSFASRYDEAYKRELDHFINVVLGKEKMIVLPQETLAVCQIASACKESVQTGLPVDIKYDFN